ncbi:10243_t:CDS:2 [Ambispora gerdemannii]|uniref:10243_t:CDS:1 n=1 Tax=Ambispora gerdemannii TaxID=144530 RepID=A0A9N8WMF4_9GLOM|nr:10243_t:CDS:2 [Ambispora gerdemannii]
MTQKNFTFINKTDIDLITFGIGVDFPKTPIDENFLPFLYVDVKKLSNEEAEGSGEEVRGEVVTFASKREFSSVVPSGPVGHRKLKIDSNTKNFLKYEQDKQDKTKYTVTNIGGKPLSIGLTIDGMIAATSQNDLEPSESIEFFFPEKYYVGIFSEIETDWPNWSAVVDAKIPLTLDSATVIATIKSGRITLKTLKLQGSNL